MGFDPLVAIPSVLLSQAFGGFTATVFHQRFKNVQFNSKSKDLKIAVIISGFGIIATIFAALISINLPTVILKTYIGVLVLIMGIITLRNKIFTFSWRKIIGVGIISAFNKGISGGGFGPVITSGQILSGQGHKSAIGVTTFAEAPICIVAFLTYIVGRVIKEVEPPVWIISVSDFFSKMFSHKIFQWELILALVIGSVLVAPFGAFTTRSLKREKMHIILGILITVLGIWTLAKTYFL